MKLIYTCMFLLPFLFLTDAAAQSSDLDPQFKVIPHEYTSTSANVTFAGPLSTAARRYQLIMHESILTDFIGKELSAVSFRLAPGASNPYPAADNTISDFEIYLSGSVPPSSRDLTDFDSHIVGVQSQVRSGNLFIPAGSYTVGSNPNAFGPEITFDSLYLYTGGHLLLEIRKPASSGSSQVVEAAGTSVPGYSTLFTACWATSPTANSGLQGNFTVVRFTFDDPVPVELTSFTAEVINNNVQLKWATATETNNKGFEVQKYQGQSVKNEGWEVIDFIHGHGTTTEVQNYIYEDKNLSAGIYLYRLKQIDFDGSYSYSKDIEIEVSIPSEFALKQNYPNPFNPATNITYSLPAESSVQLNIYNITGELVVELVNEQQPAGIYNVSFDAGRLASGAYVYRLVANDFAVTKQMLLLK